MSPKQIEKAIVTLTKKVDEVVKEVAEHDKAIAKDEKEIEKLKAEVKPKRKVMPLPTESLYAFKEGQQVALISANGAVRTHYEYVELLDKFHRIRNIQTGTEHRVWLNKLAPISEARKMMKRAEANAS